MKKVRFGKHFPKIITLGEGFDGDQMIESMQEPRYHFIVQSKLGESLKNKEGTLELSEICQLGIHLITALQDLHSLGLIHRDVKLDNILFGLNDDKTPHLIDFGCAQPFFSSTPLPLDSLSILSQN